MRAERLDPASSPLFERWTDPDSGVESYLLAERCARDQRGFAFRGGNADSDGRFLWLRIDGPDCPGDLGLVDAVEERVTAVAETRVSPGSTPSVDPETGTVYWADGAAIRRLDPRTVDPGEGHDSTGAGDVETVGVVDVEGETVECASTHATRSADGERIGLDFRAGGEWVVGALHVESGAVEEWHRFDRRWGHAQFCPADPKLLLCSSGRWADDPDHDSGTGSDAVPGVRNSLRLARHALGTRPLSHVPSGRYRSAFWAGDGAGVWIVDADAGLSHVALDTGLESDPWPAATGHADAAAGGRRVVATLPEEGPELAFRNRRRGATVTVVSAMPDSGRAAWRGPRPSFVAGGSHVAYTTTVRGRVDLALTPVRELARRTR